MVPGVTQAGLAPPDLADLPEQKPAALQVPGGEEQQRALPGQHYRDTRGHRQVHWGLRRMSKECKESIVSLFISHVLSHTSCYVSFYTFYLLIEAVPAIIN